MNKLIHLKQLFHLLGFTGLDKHTETLTHKSDALLTLLISLAEDSSVKIQKKTVKTDVYCNTVSLSWMTAQNVSLFA